jgi:hypothetical protein
LGAVIQRISRSAESDRGRCSRHYRKLNKKKRLKITSSRSKVKVRNLNILDVLSASRTAAFWFCLNWDCTTLSAVLSNRRQCFILGFIDFE